jgi:hypothetical protein
LPFPEDKVATVIDEALEETDMSTAADAVIADPSLVEDVAAAVVLEAMAEVTIAVPALGQGEITYCDARALSTNFPFCFEGVS